VNTKFFDSHGVLWVICSPDHPKAMAFGPHLAAHKVSPASCGLTPRPGETAYTAALAAGRVTEGGDSWSYLCATDNHGNNMNLQEIIEESRAVFAQVSELADCGVVNDDINDPLNRAAVLDGMALCGRYDDLREMALALAETDEDMAAVDRWFIPLPRRYG